MVFGRDGMVEAWWDETMMAMMIFDDVERESQQQIANSWWGQDTDMGIRRGEETTGGRGHTTGS